MTPTTDLQKLLTTEQLTAIIKLFPRPLFLAHYGGGDDCFVVTDGFDITIGGATVDVANAVLKLPDLAARVIELEAENKRLVSEREYWIGYTALTKDAIGGLMKRLQDWINEGELMKDKNNVRT
jgi:hypothetical protein